MQGRSFPLRTAAGSRPGLLPLGSSTGTPMPHERCGANASAAGTRDEDLLYPAGVHTFLNKRKLLTYRRTQIGEDMSWRRLPRKGPIRSHRPTISVYKSGKIVWNKDTQDALEDPAFVDVLYDEEAKRLGLRKAAQVGIEAFPVYKTTGQNTWGIYARSALQGIGIQVQQAYRRYATVKEGIAAISVAELMKEPSES